MGMTQQQTGILAVDISVSPGGRRFSLHLLTVPHFNGAVVGRCGEDGVLIRDSDSVHGSFVFVEVSDQQPFGVPT